MDENYGNKTDFVKRKNDEKDYSSLNVMVIPSDFRASKMG